MSDSRDIVIAGGGMVGVSLALQLAAVLPEETRICLVEGFPFPEPVSSGRPDYHPAFDARSTALSYSTRLIYEEIGLWHELERWLCPIDSIHVSSRGRFGSTLMRAYDYDWPALGYVVENAWLGNSLIQALYRQQRVEVRSPARVLDARASGSGVDLQLQQSFSPPSGTNNDITCTSSVARPNRQTEQRPGYLHSQTTLWGINQSPFISHCHVGQNNGSNGLPTHQRSEKRERRQPTTALQWHCQR